MSIKSRLAQKTADLVTSDAGSKSPALPPFNNKPSSHNEPSTKSPAKTEDTKNSTMSPQPGATARTGPGQMLAFRAHMLDNNQKVAALEAQLETYKDSKLVKLLDPEQIQNSKWANRHEFNFTTPEFLALKAEIESAGGNVQPILVRPIPAPINGAPSYELVYGHRRHQACRLLKLPVKAMIESLDDKTLFATMDRENRMRENLSPYEQGEMYRRALDEGLFGSLRKMAAELSVDPGNVSKAIAIARLPKEVLSAFESPTQIQYRWGKEIQAALQVNPDLVIERAKKIRNNPAYRSPQKIFDALLGLIQKSVKQSYPLKVKGVVGGSLTRVQSGEVTLQLKPSALTEEQFQAMHKQIVAFLTDL